MTTETLTKPGTYDVEITSSRLGQSTSGRDVWTLRGRVITERDEHLGAVCFQQYALSTTPFCAERLHRLLRALELPLDIKTYVMAVGRKLTVDMIHRQSPRNTRTWIDWNNERPWRDWYARANEMTQEQLDAEHVLLHADSERLMNEAEDAMRRAVYARQRITQLKLKASAS